MRTLAAVLLAVPTVALADLTETLVPLGVTGTVFGFTALIIGIITYANFRARRLRHETIRLALEKGQPLPPGLLDPQGQPSPGRVALRDLRRGIVLIGIAIGVGLFLGFSDLPDLKGSWTVAFVPGFLGVANLVSFALSRRLGGKADAEAGRG